MRRLLIASVQAFITVSAFAVWPLHVIDDQSQGPDGVKMGDANGDGLPDIATGFEQGGVTRVYLHPGKEKVGQAWPKVSVGATPDAEDARFVDLDGDGAMDVVTCCEGKTRSVFFCWAPQDKKRFMDESAWTCVPVPSLEKKAMWMFCLPMQMDGKNGVDLVMGSKDGRKSGKLGAPFGWLEAPANPRDMSAWTWHAMLEVGWTMGIEAADMDGDSDEDIVLTDRYGDASGFKWLENDGSGTWRKHDIGAVGENCMFFALADLDGDGLQDASVVTMGNKLHILRRRDKSGMAWESHDVPLPIEMIGRGKGIAAGDVDLNGSVDLVLSFEMATPPKHSLIWLSHDGSPFGGKWEWRELSGATGVKNDQVRLSDVDGDGDLDALTTEEVTNLGVIWYENPTKSAE